MSKFETTEKYAYNVDQKKVILDRLTWADNFERFLAQKYTTSKRFGLEGGEALIPGMKAVIDSAVDLGVDSIVMGMAHRGRFASCVCFDTPA